MYMWRFDPEAKEFNSVIPAMKRNDPAAYYVTRDDYGDLLVHDPWGRECPAYFDFVEVFGMRFDRKQFDPERIDHKRTDKQPIIRSLFSLTSEQVEVMRAEMRRDGQWMRDQLAARNSNN